MNRDAEVVMKKNKSVAVITNAFREAELIEHCIKQFSKQDLYHVVMSPRMSWNGNLYQDNTPDLARQYGASLVIEGDFKTEAQQFNYGLNLLRDYKYVWIVDADERYYPDEIPVILDILEHTEADGVKSFMDVYWKTREYKITPPQTDYPLIAVKPTVHFSRARSTDADDIKWIPYTMHHLSYVRSDEDMLKKIRSFSHSDEFDLNDWYQNKWLKWKPDMMDLHPVQASQFKSAVYNPLPNKIKV